MKQLIILPIILGLFSCADPDIRNRQMPSFPKGSLEIPKDTIQEIDMSQEPELDTSDITGMVIKIDPSGAFVESNYYTVDYPDPVKRLVAEFDDNGNIEFLKVNNTILFNTVDRFTINHTYVYTDTNTIIVQEGNTLEAIITDHKRQGYDISKQSIIKCNPYLSNGRHLKVGDLLRLECQ